MADIDALPCVIWQLVLTGMMLAFLRSAFWWAGRAKEGKGLRMINELYGWKRDAHSCQGRTLDRMAGKAATSLQCCQQPKTGRLGAA
jgi:hypothetical protein